MKKLYLVLCLLWPVMAHLQVTIQATVNGYGDKIVIGYWKDFAYISDALWLNKHKADFKFDSSEPVYFNLRTTDPDTYTPFLIGLPGDTISIEKDTKNLVIKGGAEGYNTFLTRLVAEMRAKFAGMPPDPNMLTQYVLDRSEAFFSTFKHPQKQLIQDINTLSAIINYKLYPLILKYSEDATIMNSVSSFIKNQGVPDANGDDKLKYLDKLNFNNPNIGFANLPDIMMINNLIRILRKHAVEKDTTLKDSDAYVIENNIIKNLFKESRYRSRLLAYNLYRRINQYIEYPMQLAGAEDFISDFKKENFNTDLLPAIEKLYSSQLASIGSLSKGAVAPAFKLPDTKGKSVQLSDFKGKVVYLDIWATWCGPCLKEMPYLNLLKEKFRNKDVEMITISIDTKVDAWLAKVAAMKMEGTQLIDSNGSENSKIAEDYKIHGVPHYVLIDKNGRIASASAPRPSMEAEVEEQINALLSDAFIAGRGRSDNHAKIIGKVMMATKDTLPENIRSIEITKDDQIIIIYSDDKAEKITRAEAEKRRLISSGKADSQSSPGKTNPLFRAHSPNYLDSVLLLLNGVRITRADLQKIAPANIESVHVLKDKSAVDKYGERARRGAVEIVLKKDGGVK